MMTQLQQQLAIDGFMTFIDNATCEQVEAKIAGLLDRAKQCTENRQLEEAYDCIWGAKELMELWILF